mgnify:CR=1 FL=1
MDNNRKTDITDDISIVIAGRAGQGIQSIQQVLTYTLKRDGFHVFTTKEYMSRVRGGVNSTEIRITSKNRNAYVDSIDLFVPLSDEITPFLRNRITEQTIVIADRKNGAVDKLGIEDAGRTVDLSFLETAKEIGSKLYTNTVAVGFLGGLLSMNRQVVDDYIAVLFEDKGDDVVANNKKAVEAGYQKAEELKESLGLTISIESDDETKENLLLSGKDAVSLGALAGGCNVISSYPMSPSTGVLVSLAEYSHETDIIVEQAESEIAAVNMALGAWYAGGRAMVTTSGGGLDLMAEGVSLTAMLESPMVFHVAQRPGPATGLPTRTAQEDLELVIHAGHGEFARAVFAPGNTLQGYSLTRHAFNLADRYQVPAFVLTDQYFVDSYYDVRRDAFDEVHNEHGVESNIVETNPEYGRYTLGNGGISYRGIPGWGEGLVKVDSDEHNEEGLITEEVTEIRPAMVDKRWKTKMDHLREQIVEPDLYGNSNYRILLIAWGSTLNTVLEAMERVGRKDVALLHYTQVYPLSASTAEYLKATGQSICIENNAAGQFARLIRAEFGQTVDDSILKYNGIPFSVEEVAEKIEEKLEG